jgi:hypothetical protein
MDRYPAQNLLIMMLMNAQDMLSLGELMKKMKRDNRTRKQNRRNGFNAMWSSKPVSGPVKVKRILKLVSNGVLN